MKIGVCFLKIGVCFSKIGVCFFCKSEFVFQKSEFVFLKIEVSSEYPRWRRKTDEYSKTLRLKVTKLEITKKLQLMFYSLLEFL